MIFPIPMKMTDDFDFPFSIRIYFDSLQLNYKNVLLLNWHAQPRSLLDIL